MKIKKVLVYVAAVAALWLGSLIAGESVYRGVYTESGSDSDSGSINNIPAGAWVIVEGWALEGSSCYAGASGGGVNLSISGSNGSGGGDYAQTTYGSSISYSVSVSGTAYAFVEVDWGY